MDVMHLKAVFLIMHMWQKCDMVLKVLVTLKWWHILTSFYSNVFWAGHGGSLHTDLSVSLSLSQYPSSQTACIINSVEASNCFHVSLEWLTESWVTQTSWSHLGFLLKLLLLNHLLLLCAHLGCLKCTSCPLSKSVADFIESNTLVFPVGPKTASAEVFLDYKMASKRLMLTC